MWDWANREGLHPKWTIPSKGEVHPSTITIQSIKCKWINIVVLIKTNYDNFDSINDKRLTAKYYTGHLILNKSYVTNDEG